jgi:hypothetical protein
MPGSRRCGPPPSAEPPRGCPRSAEMIAYPCAGSDESTDSSSTSRFPLSRSGSMPSKPMPSNARCQWRRRGSGSRSRVPPYAKGRQFPSVQIGRLGERSPGMRPSLSVTEVIGITSRPTFAPARSDTLELAGDARHVRTTSQVFAIDLNPELVRTGRAHEEVERSLPGTVALSDRLQPAYPKVLERNPGGGVGSGPGCSWQG